LAKGIVEDAAFNATDSYLAHNDELVKLVCSFSLQFQVYIIQVNEISRLGPCVLWSNSAAAVFGE